MGKRRMTSWDIKAQREVIDRERRSGLRAKALTRAMAQAGAALAMAMRRSAPSRSFKLEGDAIVIVTVLCHGQDDRDLIDKALMPLEVIPGIQVVRVVGYHDDAKARR